MSFCAAAEFERRFVAIDSFRRSSSGVETASGMQPKFTNDPLGRALLPVLLHRIQNVTQTLTNLKSLSELEDASELLAGRAGEDLADAGARTLEVGWLLAVLAGGAGTDVLLARRAEHGLAPFLALVREGVRRERRDLAPESGPLPRLSPHSQAAGWELCWCLGSVLLAAAMGLPEGACLDWRLERDGPSAGDTAPERRPWKLAVPGTFGDQAVAAALSAVRRVESVELETRSDGWTLHLPGPWLVQAPEGDDLESRRV